MGPREQCLFAGGVVECPRVLAVVALHTARFGNFARHAAQRRTRIVDVRRARAMAALTTDTGAFSDLSALTPNPGIVGGHLFTAHLNPIDK